MASEASPEAKPAGKVKKAALIGVAVIGLVLGGAKIFGGARQALDAVDAGARTEVGRDFEAAADTLAARLGPPGQKAEMPAANDPAVLAFNEQAEKAMAALGTPALPVRGFDSFQALCGKVVPIVSAYVTAGTGAAAPDGASAAQQQLMMANAERYSEQMFVPVLFSTHCMAAHVPFMDEQVDPTDAEKRSGAVQVRGGLFRQAAGLMQMASDLRLDPARKRRVIDLLATDGPTLAIALAPAQRQQLAAMAQELRPLLPRELQDKADRFRSGIENARCGKICSI